MQALSCCSSAAQPCAVYPEDAQQPIVRLEPAKCYALLSGILRTEDITPTQGLASALSGRRTRSLGSGGRRGAAALVTACVFLTTIVDVCRKSLR